MLTPAKPAINSLLEDNHVLKKEILLYNPCLFHFIDILEKILSLGKADAKIWSGSIKKHVMKKNKHMIFQKIYTRADNKLKHLQRILN